MMKGHWVKKNCIFDTCMFKKYSFFITEFQEVNNYVAVLNNYISYYSIQFK
jgi:hypothetical protein